MSRGRAWRRNPPRPLFAAVLKIFCHFNPRENFEGESSARAALSNGGELACSELVLLSSAALGLCFLAYMLDLVLGGGLLFELFLAAFLLAASLGALWFCWALSGAALGFVALLGAGASGEESA